MLRVKRWHGTCFGVCSLNEISVTRQICIERLLSDIECFKRTDKIIR